jgi:hypothetical protein
METEPAQEIEAVAPEAVAMETEPADDEFQAM